MSNICGVCATQKIYDNERIMYKRCAPCKRKKVLKYYYNNKETVLETSRNYYHNNKEYFREYNKKRKNKIRDFENQLKQLTEMVQTVIVSWIIFSMIQ